MRVSRFSARAGGVSGRAFHEPAVYSFEERVRVNGQPIAYEELASVTEAVKQVAETLEEHPTEFELLTGVAFTHFVRSHCDVVVVEVGMGGRLDSTNVIETPEVAVITPISFDHCAFLGDTLAEIAGEKAGIIKPGSPVVCAPQMPEAEAVIRQVAHEHACPFVRVDLSQEQGSEECFSYRQRHDLALGMRGVFQLENAATALDALDVLKQRGWTIPEEAIREGLRLAHWPGRFEAVSAEPLIIFDGGHNLSGISALSASLEHAYRSTIASSSLACSPIRTTRTWQKCWSIWPMRSLRSPRIMHAPLLRRTMWKPCAARMSSGVRTSWWRHRAFQRVWQRRQTL